jgi:hypothetical protein
MFEKVRFSLIQSWNQDQDKEYIEPNNNSSDLVIDLAGLVGFYSLLNIITNFNVLSF